MKNTTTCLTITETEEDVANYLTIVLEEQDASELAHALGVIARAA